MTVASGEPGRGSENDPGNSEVVSLEAMGRRLTKESALTFLGQFLLKGITVVASVVLARILGVEALGVWAVVTATGGLVWIFAEMGLGNAAVRVIAEASHDAVLKSTAESTALLLSLAVGIPVGLVFLLLSPVLASSVYGSPELTLLFILLAITSLLQVGQNIFSAILQARRRISLLAVAGLTFGALNAVALVLGAYLFGLVGVFVASLGMMVVSTVGFWALLRKTAGRWKRLILERGIARRLVRLGLPGMALNQVAAIGFWLALTFLTLKRSYEDVGFFNVAWRAAGFLSFPTAAVFTALFPLTSELYSSDPRLFGRVYRVTIKYAVLTIIPLSLIFVLASPEILTILYGSAFIPAAPMLSVLIGSGFLMAIAPWGSILFYASDSVNRAFYAFSVAVVFQITLAALLIPTFGAPGILVSTIAYCFVATVLTPLLTPGQNLRKLVAMPFAWAVCIATGLSILGIFATSLALIPRMVVLGLALVAYTWLINMFALTDRDRRFIRGLLHSTSRRLRFS